MIAKLKRERFGPSSERRRRLLDQLELQLEELEASAGEDAYAADEVGYGPDLDDSVLVWQTVPVRYPPQPGAGRQVIVDRDLTRAMIVA